MNLPFTCENCDTKADCKRAFGKFWLYKSFNGVGCTVKFPGYAKTPEQLHAERVRQAWDRAHEIAHVTRGTDGGIYRQSKRNTLARSRRSS